MDDVRAWMCGKAPGGSDAQVLDVCIAPGNEFESPGCVQSPMQATSDDEVRMCSKPRATMDNAGCVAKPRSMAHGHDDEQYQMCGKALVDVQWLVEITGACM